MSKTDEMRDNFRQGQRTNERTNEPNNEYTYTYIRTRILDEVASFNPKPDYPRKKFTIYMPESFSFIAWKWSELLKDAGKSKAQWFREQVLNYVVTNWEREKQRTLTMFLEKLENTGRCETKGCEEKAIYLLRTSYSQDGKEICEACFQNRKRFGQRIQFRRID